MGLLTESFTADGLQKSFAIAGEIPSESHCRAHFFYDDIDHPIVSSEWDLLGNILIFNVAPTAGYIVKITVSSDGSGLDDAPSDISDVAANISDLLIVSSMNAEVSAVAAQSSNIDTIMTQVIPNITEILLADDNAVTATTQASNAATSASNAATSESNAATSETNAADSLSSLNSLYSSSTAEPSSPVEGQLWFDETSDIMKVYSGSGFVAAGSSVNGTTSRHQYTATASQTTFSATYDSGYVDVFLNGIKLHNSDFTATDGANVILTSAAALGDIVDILAYGTFELADHYNKAESDVKHRSVPMKVKATEDIAVLNTVKGSGYNSGEDAIEVLKTVAQTDIAIGITKAPITNGEFSDVVTKGLIENVDTSSWAFGDILYSDALGALTSTKPSGAYQAVAYVVKNHAVNGAVMVNIGEPAIPVDLATYVENTDYATSTVGGTVKARLDGSTFYLTINGNNA